MGRVHSKLRFCLAFSIIFLLVGTSAILGQAEGVKIVKNQGKGLIEIKTKHLGVQIPYGSFGKNSKGLILAPIQAFIYADGNYSDDTPNFLESDNEILSGKSEIISQSKDEIVVQLIYKCNKRKYGGTTFKERGAEAGPGTYKCTIRIRTKAKSLLILEEADFEVSYKMKVSNGLFPNKARYRGWASNSTEFGYETEGKIYRPETQRGYPMDATVDLKYDKAISYPGLYLWEPEGGEINSGRYWQLFNSVSNNNLFGFFSGRPSKLVGANFATVNLELDKKNSQESERAELRMKIVRMAPDGVWYPRKRFEWGVFISTKTDLSAPDKTQGIGREMNKVSGIAEILSKPPDGKLVLSEAFYKGALFMPHENVERLCQLVKTDVTVYNELVEKQGSYKSIWDMWRYKDSAKSMKDLFVNKADELLEEYTNGEGSYRLDFRYWKGARIFKYYAICISSLFADKSIYISPAEKKKLETCVFLMYNILCNAENVPIQDSSGVNLGTINMSFQYRSNGEYFFSLLFKAEGTKAESIRRIINLLKTDIRNTCYSNGAPFGSPHYVTATMEPILFAILQAKQAGYADLFRDEKSVRLFAEFYLSLLTPESCRFENIRKLISFGDGSEEGSPIFGLLAMGFRNIDKELYVKLISVYKRRFAPSSFSGPSALAIGIIQESNSKLAMESSNYSGYVSNLRSNSDTKYESSAWILNGEVLRDHRNDDAGEMAVYAIGAPLSLSRSSFYYPHATDARIRSVVVPLNIFPQWNSSNQPISGHSLTNRTWPESKLESFAKFRSTVVSNVQMNGPVKGEMWQRQVVLLSIDSSLPIFVIYDSTVQVGRSVWSMTFMSEGPVYSSAGELQAPLKIHNNSNLQELPAAGDQKELAVGWNLFKFKGQNWPLHFSKGIDWNLHTYVKQRSSATLSRWQTNWQNDIEKNEYRQSNGKPYSEEQQILRINTGNEIFNVLLPFPKGKNPYDNAIQQMENGLVVVKLGNEVINIEKQGCTVDSKNRVLLSLFRSSSRVSLKGFSISNGQAEMETSKNLVIVRVHGSSGKRIIEVPFSIKSNKPYAGVNLSKTNSGSRIVIDYKSDSFDCSPYGKGFVEFIFERI